MCNSLNFHDLLYVSQYKGYDAVLQEPQELQNL